MVELYIENLTQVAQFFGWNYAYVIVAIERSRVVRGRER